MIELKGRREPLITQKARMKIQRSPPVFALRGYDVAGRAPGFFKQRDSLSRRWSQAGRRRGFGSSMSPQKKNSTARDCIPSRGVFRSATSSRVEIT
jgi:hypothetical protein